MMSTPAPSPSSSSNHPASSPSSSVASVSVWSDLLSKSTRRSKENNSTLIILGEKQTGKSQLIAKFADRVQVDNTTTAATTPTGEYAVDYAVGSVRNTNAPPGEKEDVLARMHMWSLDEPQHANIIPTMLLSNQSSTLVDLSATTTPSAPLTQPTLQSATLTSTAVLVTFDMSEPWRVLENVRTWLESLEKVMNSVMAQMPAEEATTLRANISKHIQSYHIAAAGLQSSPSSSDDGQTLDDEPPLDPNIPSHNLGVPIILVGLRTDLFARNLPSKAAADEQFEYLTRQLRKLALEYGAALIYTSTGSGRGARDRHGPGHGQVNIEQLRQYIFHRLYNFALTPHVGDETNGAATAANGIDLSSPSSSTSSSAPAPKLVGGTEEFGIYIPAGYDSLALLDVSAKNAVSAAFSDATPVTEVFKMSSTPSSKAKTFERLVAEENATYFRAMKSALEQGVPLQLQSATQPKKPHQPSASISSTVGMTSSSSSHSLAPPPSASPVALHTPPATAAAAGVAAAAPSSAGSSTGASTGVAGVAPTATGVGAAGGAPVKGQAAVKNFFRSLLTNTSKPGDGSQKAAAAQKAVRASAEKELSRMTATDSAAQNNGPSQQ